MFLAPGEGERPIRANLSNRLVVLCHFCQSPSGPSLHINITSKASAPMTGEAVVVRQSESDNLTDFDA